MSRSFSLRYLYIAFCAAERAGQKLNYCFVGGSVHGRRSHFYFQLVAERRADFVL